MAHLFRSRRSWGQLPGEERCGPPEDLVLLLEEPVAFLQLPQLSGVGILPPRPDNVLGLGLGTLQPIRYRCSADPEIVRDLTQRNSGLAVLSDADYVVTKLARKRLRHGVQPSSDASQHHRSDATSSASTYEIARSDALETVLAT